MKKRDNKKRAKYNRLIKKRLRKFLKNKFRNKSKSSKSILLSPLLKYLKKNNYCKNMNHDRHNCSIIIPTRFSLNEEPEESLEIISKLINAVVIPSMSIINIDHSDCTLIDMGASTIMDIIILEAKKEWLRKRKASPLRGRYSRTEKVNEILKVAGLHKHIGHFDAQNLPEEIKKNYITFDLVIGKKEDNTKLGMSSYRETVATQLTTYFNDILKKHHFQLTMDGKSKLSALITEVLDNTEQHSNTLHWYVTGYRDESGIINICILNFGDSIHKTLSSANLDKYTKDNILALIEKHTKSGFFNLKNKWSEESLWTLYALQEGISRFNTEESIKDDTIRGTGTTKLIEFFMKLSSKNDDNNMPKMVIISGNTYILFDNKYKLKDKILTGGDRKIIAFNDSNDLNERPDPNNVKTLKYNFPGTVISLKFKLDNDYLQSIKEINNNG